MPSRKALVLLPLIGLMGVAAWAVVRITSAPPSRRMLLRVATIDEQLAGTEPDPQLDRERERLMERLLAD